MKKLIIFTGITYFTILFSACDNWLTLEPQDEITGNEYWKTKEQVNAELVGCYSSLLQNPSGSSRTLPEYLFLWGELRGDLISYNSGVKFDEYSVMNGIISQDQSLCNWNDVYRTINYCNTLIAKAPDVLKTDHTFTETQLNQYISEALTIRSLMYFYLVRVFSDVPLKLDATLSDGDNFQIPKSNTSLVLNQIVSDLATAEKNAVTTYGTDKLDKGRVTKYTINAIQADVYLWREQYDSCIIACDKIINSGQFGLVTEYRSLFTQGQTGESIFELEFDPQALNPFYTMFSTSKGRRFLAAQRVVDDIYMVDENNPEVNYDRRGNNASIKYSNLSIWKYLGLNSSTGRTEEESYAPWILYRYADVLLMKAEACAQIGRGQETKDLIERVRERAHAIDATAQDPAPDDVDGLTDYVLAERAREFSFEGKRWFDLLRNAKREHYRRIGLLTDLVIKVAPDVRMQTMLNNIQDTLSHYLPIYYYELETNKKLEQNPFYKSEQ